MPTVFGGIFGLSIIFYYKLLINFCSFIWYYHFLPNFEYNISKHDDEVNMYGDDNDMNQVIETFYSIPFDFRLELQLQKAIALKS